MSNYLDAIPPAVATIVTSISGRLGAVNSAADLETLQKRVIDITDQLTRTFAKALIDAQTGKP